MLCDNNLNAFADHNVLIQVHWPFGLNCLMFGDHLGNRDVPFCDTVTWNSNNKNYEVPSMYMNFIESVSTNANGTDRVYVVLFSSIYLYINSIITRFVCVSVYVCVCV
jgi:hypothetical protein